MGAALPADLDRWLAAREAAAGGITPGAEKQIRWHGAPGERRPLALVYVHGFSACGQESRPVPEMAAEALGANLFLTRLSGHGQDGAALAAARAGDWQADLAEALALGARLGERVVVMACSTGAALVLAALAGQPPAGADRVAGVVMLSPNFRLASRWRNAVLDLPGAGWLVPRLVGAEQHWPALNPGHARYWTLDYPTRALLPMAQVMRAARRADPARVTVPLLLLQSPQDVVVDPGFASRRLARWGGPLRHELFAWRAGMDREAHVIAGAIRSPGMSDEVAARVIDWMRGI